MSIIYRVQCIKTPYANQTLYLYDLVNEKFINNYIFICHLINLHNMKDNKSKFASCEN